MPRGSKPGERRGGRQRGTPNKKTALASAAFAAAASNPDMTPLDFLLGIMRDPTVSPELRIKGAQAAAPFVHAKPGRSHPVDPMTNAKQIEGISDFVIEPGLARRLRDDRERLKQLERKRSGGPPSAAEEQEESSLRARIAETARTIGCPANYGFRESLKDQDRLHLFFCKRISPPSCGGGPLSEADDAEEAQLTARVAAFEETPEGRGRRRKGDLTMKGFFKPLSAAEQNELDSLQALYPNLPFDPNDPADVAAEAVMEAYKKLEGKGVV